MLRILFASLIPAIAAQAAVEDGSALFTAHCAQCHNTTGKIDRAPAPDLLKKLSKETILAALRTGSMKAQAAMLSPAETVAIYKLVRAGRMAEALDIHRWFLPLLELDLHPKLVQYIKLAEAEVGLGTEHVRAPRLPLAGKEREQVLAVIRKGVAARPKVSEYAGLAV